MIPETFPHLHALHVAACDALRKAGAICILECETTVRGLHHAACGYQIELTSARAIAVKAGVFPEVDAVTAPALAALRALIQACREEMATEGDDRAA